MVVVTTNTGHSTPRVDKWPKLEDAKEADVDALRQLIVDKLNSYWLR